MDTRRFFRTCVSICFFEITAILSACARPVTEMPNYSSPTSPVTSPIQQPTETPAFYVPATIMPTETLIPFSTTVPVCSNGLTYLYDVTIPDSSVVAPGSTLDKQWQVQNTGTCDWDNHYRLRLVSGVDMGIQEQALYPARAGMKVVLQLTLNAPQEVGSYTNTWQAIAPDGNFFGDVVILIIIVQ